MNEKDSKVIMTDDFNVICRVCLQKENDMVDIFDSGINYQLKKLASLKIKPDDQLPQSLCLNCYNQINQLAVFVEQAKSSEIYLKSLLSKSAKRLEDVDSQSTGNHVREKKYSTAKKKYSRKKKKWLKKSTLVKQTKSELESDKMYLVYVPDTDDSQSKTDNEIYIKDITTDGDNLVLTNYYKTLVSSHFSDHTYPKEKKNSEEEDCQLEIFKSHHFADLKCDDSKTIGVNFHIYECGECRATYEEFDDLTSHLSTHETQPTFLRIDYCCPVCNFLVEEKSIFMDHLKSHKNDGYVFVKVNRVGDTLHVEENERDIFMDLSPPAQDCIVFCLNLNSLNCPNCCESIQSIDSVPEHLQTCLKKDKLEIKFNVKYTCPICKEIFFDNEENFLTHLNVHKQKNYYFIKIDNLGEPVENTGYEDLFVPFKEAEKIFSKKNTVFEIVDMNSCDKCDYSSESFKELCDHTSFTHFEELSNDILYCCPVCLKECNDGDVETNQTDFYNHLKIHTSEGVTFILVKKNGTSGDLREKYSDIFTQSKFLWSLIYSPNMIVQNIFPELEIIDEENSPIKYTCDLCQEQFKNKLGIINHLKSHQIQEIVQDTTNYICEKCGKKCAGKANYKKHFLKHSKILSSVCKRPVCKICNKKFANRATLNCHMKHHLKEENGNELHNSLPGIICEKCGRSFSSNAGLAKHKKMHLKEKENTVLKCEICDRDFFRQSSFDRHRSAHLNPKYFECSICKLPLPSVVSLQKHSEIHKNGSNTFDCKACELSFLTKDSLTAHQTHTGHYTGRKPLECNVCHEKFFIARKFSEHIKTHPKYKIGECTLCGKRLSTIQSLMIHTRRHFESNSILCPHCGKQFFEERNYHRHLLTHEGIKPFACDTEGCKKSFYTFFELNRHKKYHNNTRDFRCIYCSKSFHEANHLTVHIRTHTGERPYTCPHCNKGFVTRTQCKHHIKVVHQGVGYDLIRSNISKNVPVFENVEAVT